MSGCASLPSLTSLMPSKVAASPQNLEAQLSLARLSERQGDVQTAERIYQAVLAKQPQNQLVLHRLGVLAAKANDPEQAAQYFQAASQAGPPSAELLNDIGFNLFALGRGQEAEGAYRQALELDPRNQAARNNLGLLLGETGRYDESLAEFRRAGRDEAEAMANLAFAQTQAGDVNAAKASYHRALGLNAELKPAAEALVQLTRQSLPTDQIAAGQGDAAWVDADIKSLPELVREGKTADFIESAIERRRGDGRKVTAARSRKFEGAVQQAAYLAPSAPEGGQEVPLRTPRTTAQRGANAATERSTKANESLPDPTARGTGFGATAGAKRVLSSVFRFPIERQASSDSGFPGRTPESELAAAPAARPRIAISQELPDAASLTEAEPPPAARPQRLRRATLHEAPRNLNQGPGLPAPTPPTEPSTAATQAGVQRSPGDAPTVAPALFMSSVPGPSGPSPWQAPTWTPALGAALSAGDAPLAQAPEAASIPMGPLANLTP